MPKLIKFDEEDSETVSLPKAVTKMSVAVGEQEKVFEQFMTEYYRLYDSDSRQPLLAAYHDSAMMSMSVSTVQNASGKG